MVAMKPMLTLDGGGRGQDAAHRGGLGCYSKPFASPSQSN